MPPFSRTKQLIGSSAFSRLEKAEVAVFGLGAVGSHVVEALARSGVGGLRIVDFDVIGESNINRQLYAFHSTVGLPKTDCAAERIRAINPHCRIDIRRVFIDNESLPHLLEHSPDCVVDAIDSVSSKVHLIRHAVERHLPVVASMGAAGRLLDTDIRSADLDETFNCPLARMIRKRLHRHGIHRGVRCVFSPLPADNKNPPVEEDIEPYPQKRGRIRPPLGSICHTTGMFGYRVAREVIAILLYGTDSPAASARQIPSPTSLNS